MTYTAEISRRNPTCFIFMLDQSGSMQDTFVGGERQKPKAKGVAEIINRALQELVILCARDTGVYDYLFISVLGYGNSVDSAWSGALSGRELVAISEIANDPARIEERGKKVDDGAGGFVEQKVKFPIWFDPIANGGTPMCKALDYAKAITAKWVTEHPDSYPPTVINITDGESTDGDPSLAAESIRNLQTRDGNVLLFNVHLSSTSSSPIPFPGDEMRLPDQYSQLLFRMSSIMPPQMQAYAASLGFAASETSRGFMFNADQVSLVQFLNIGTRPSNLR